DFRPVRTLGKGGHGKVYLVQDVVSERYLAMKVIEKNGLRMREYPTVFEEQAVSHALVANGDEARLGSGGSPWLAPLLGSFEDSDNFYFLTEYYPGGDLMKVIKRQGVVPVHRARRWCAELLVALEHLHDQRIIHRDVKPENILIDENDHIALTDFGIARAFGTPDTERPWRHLNPFPTDADETCSLVGTPGYTAPEVYSGRYTYGADVWGAGVVLHTMLTGRLPFGLNPHEQRLEELIMRTDTLPADYDLHGNVDREARDVLIQMLEKDPARRPSIGELKQHRWFRGV
ncbi:kinase-like domain-containing protein, partial [Earliella scabrosa]